VGYSLTQRWYPDSCACVIDCEAPHIEGKFVIQCRAHNRTVETYAHNISLKEKPIDRETDRKKPQFQRR